MLPSELPDSMLEEGTCVIALLSIVLGIIWDDSIWVGAAVTLDIVGKSLDAGASDDCGRLDEETAGVGEDTADMG